MLELLHEAEERRGRRTSEGKGASSIDANGTTINDAPFLSGVQPTCNLRLRTSRILTVVRAAKPGDGRNSKLYWAACRFGELIAAGSATREIAQFMLLSAARYNGHVTKRGLAQTLRTIRSGLDRRTQASDPIFLDECEEAAS
jgi:hypothetical protein